MTISPQHQALANRIVTLENRVVALEQMLLLSIGGSIKTPTEVDSIEAVRTFLSKVEIADLPKDTVEFLGTQLTVDWRHLMREYNWPIVFRLLRDGYSVPEVRRHFK